MDSDTKQLTGYVRSLHMPESGVGAYSHSVTRRILFGPVSDGVPAEILCRVAIGRQFFSGCLLKLRWSVVSMFNVSVPFLPSQIRHLHYSETVIILRSVSTFYTH